MSLNVVLSVPGKFHTFHLARHLHREGMLESIFSTYPLRKLGDQGIPTEKIRTYPLHWLLWRAYSTYVSRQDFIEVALQRQHWKSFDRYVAAHLPPCDIFVGLSGPGLKTGQLNQKRGGLYVCDHGSSHICYRNEVMTEEFKRWKVEPVKYDPLYTARQQEEYENADVVTVPSEFVRRSFIDQGVRAEKVIKVPYGADTSRFSKVADPPHDTFNVLFVGQVSLRKGLPYLLEAFKAFSHPHKRLTIVGGIQPDMKALLEQNGQENIEFTGQIPHSKLKEIMSRSHVMVVPSIEEGLAMVQGEAMACGCPLISSTNTGAEDLLRSGTEGFIVPIRNSAAITTHLEQLAQDPELRLRMSEACLERVKDLGGWEKYGNQYAQVLKQLAKGHFQTG